jgi:protein-S-isoprenylcysteine O-methyltransferase Ste14
MESTGKRTAIDLGRVQLLRKGILLTFIVLGVTFVVGDTRWPSGSFVHEQIEFIGLILVVICICGRIYCTLYIGGRKIESLVTTGPYSVTRNPLYFFSVIGAVGAGAQLGSFILAFTTGLVAYLVFLLVIFKEEAVLASRLGDAFAEYSSVPRLWPRLSLWRDSALVEVDPRLVRTTALDASVFLVSIPIAEGFEHLHNIGWLPTLLTLP